MTDSFLFKERTREQYNEKYKVNLYTCKSFALLQERNYVNCMREALQKKGRRILRLSFDKFAYIYLSHIQNNETKVGEVIH